MASFQTGAAAFVRTTKRIKIRIAKTNAPAPKSMTSLITSGFSRSSRRTKAPRKIGGGGGHESPLRTRTGHGTFDATVVVDWAPRYWCQGPRQTPCFDGGRASRPGAAGRGRPASIVQHSRRILRFAGKLLHAASLGPHPVRRAQLARVGGGLELPGFAPLGGRGACHVADGAEASPRAEIFSLISLSRESWR